MLRRTDALVQTADALWVQADVFGGAGRAFERAEALREAARLYARKGNVIGERTALRALADHGR
jgi:hypothetical protein